MSVEEISIVKENPPSESMGLESPSMDFAIRDEIVGNSSEIECFQTKGFSEKEENTVMKIAEFENPVVESMNLDNKLTDFAISDQVVGNLSEIECFQSKEIPKEEENPLVESMTSENPSSDSVQIDETLDGSSKIEEEVKGNENFAKIEQKGGEIAKTLDGCSKIDEVKCNENFAEIDQKGGEITKNLDVDDEFVKGINVRLDDAEIKNVIDETSNEGAEDLGVTESAKTLSEISQEGIKVADLLDDDDEDTRLFRGRWSEGRYGYNCKCSRCFGDEVEEDRYGRTHRLGCQSHPRWFWNNRYHANDRGQMDYMYRGYNSKRHCRRRDLNFRREREEEHFGLSLDDCIGVPEPDPCPVGAGLANLGNTCFLNAILQCFTHTVPLVQGVLYLKHQASSHGADEFCVLCAVRSQIEHSFVHSGRVISPSKLVDNLSNISSFFRRYQQEDAHEFLQCLLDKLDSNWSKYEASADVSTLSGDTLVEQIFGGRLVSQVQCCKCGHSSDTHEPLIDLSLEIEDVDSLESALKSFTKVESLEITEKFTCDSCKEQVKVEKQLMLDKAPSVAALHLKRFKNNGFLVEKLDKKVDFPLELDLCPYTKGSNDGNEDLKYELYALVVHVGLSLTSGHYFCYIRTSPQKWYRFDDSQVTEVDEENVLCQDAYILFYAKKGTPWFDSLFENWKAECREKILSTSPKSVLDDMDIPSTSYSVSTGLLGRGAIEDTSTAPLNEPNEVLVQNKPGLGTYLHDTEVDGKRDASGEASIETASELVKDEVKTKAGIDALDSAVANQAYSSASTMPIDIGNNVEVKEDDSEPDVLLMEEGNGTEGRTRCMKIGEIEPTSGGESCSPSHLENTFSGMPKNEAGFSPSTPLKALSPDIYSDEDASEEAYCIPINHLKIEDKPSSSSAKKSINKFNTQKQDMKRKEAVKYIRKSMPSGRGHLLMAALNGSKSDSLLSKKRRKQGLFPHARHSPKKRVKVSPKRVLRTVTA